MKNKKIVFTAGGTGGHLFPSIAVAKEMKKDGFRVFLITDKRGKQFTEKGVFEKVISIPAGGMVGKSKFFKLMSLAKLAIGSAISFLRLLILRPNMIVGFGGYTTVSVILSGWILRKNIIIHSADSVMGLSNKILCRFANKILTSFEKVSGIPAGNENKIIFTGLPLRENILKLSETKNYTLPKGKEKINILITGGSQGSAALGDQCAKAFSLLDDKLKKKLFINHQVRKEDITEVMSIYKNAGISDSVICKPFFDNMSEIYKDCHLFIGRSGASSVVENALLGVPSIFVPLWHKDRQQFLNAEQLTSVGGAIMIEPKEYSSENLKNILENMLNDKVLAKMNKSLSKVSIKNGSIEIPLILKKEF